jgi:hypothetical protein
MALMPRRLKLTDEEQYFIKNNAYKGGKWLADQLGVHADAIYQYGHDNKISMKNQEIVPKSMKDRRNAWAWPRPYKKYKKMLVERDGLRCHYCDYLMSYQEAQIDHILAQSRGGSDAPINLVLACSRCNGLKSSLCYSCPDFRNAIGR